MRLIVFLLLPLSVFSQQDPLSGMYWNNYAVYNPATSGLEYKQDAYITYRDQWKDINGAPTTIFGNYNRRLADHHGIGVNYYFEEIGNSKVQSGNINYNYQFLLKNESKLALGVAAGLYTLKYDDNWITPTTYYTGDPSIPSTDPYYSLNLNAGVAFLTKNLYLGAGMLHLDETAVRDVYQKRLHSYFNARYIFNVGPESKLYTNSLIATDWIKTSADFNIQFKWRSQFWIGVGYRTSRTWTANLGWDIKKRYRIGYQFENYLSKLNGLNTQTHEVILGFYLK